MLNTVILKRNRGEGKTKWLIKKALAELDAGNTNVYYSGSVIGHTIFCNSFERDTGEKCKIRLLDSTHHNVMQNTVYLTDELLEELPFVQYELMKRVGGTWYVTISGENVVEE